ncbi:DUF4397 domain-containing protein [Ilumatobacter sp.]|uniref:DUF4397 domain-containing protein n=1 Tax=Ilumatobacter sp. TaxID=1967498 RepID=UPI003B51AE1D
MRKWAVATAAIVASVTGAGVAHAQLSDSVTILHAIPGVTVDLVVDGEIIVAGFDAGDTQDLTSLAGTTLTDVEGRRSGSEEVVIGPIASFDVPAAGNVSNVLHLDAGAAPTITSFENQPGPDEQGRGRLTVRHVAAAAPVSVTVAGDEVLTGIANGQGDGVVLPAGEIVGAAVTVDGAPVASMPNLQLEANSELIVYIGGSAADDTLAFYLQSIAGGNVQMLPPPSERQADDAGGETSGDTGEETSDEETSDEAAANDSDDGTPQPSRVDTGGALIAQGSFDDANRAVVPALLGVALIAIAVLATSDRRRRTPDVTDDLAPGVPTGSHR